MKKIIISGFGGQGVLSLGKFLAEAAMTAGLNVSWLPSYGPEMRGGTANCSVVINEGEVASPVIARPDILVAMNKPSLDKFLPAVEEGGAVLCSGEAGEAKGAKKGVSVFEVPVDELAAKLNPRGANVIMLGAAMQLLSFLPFEAAKHAIEKGFSSKPQLIDVNLECLRCGYTLKLSAETITG